MNHDRARVENGLVYVIEDGEEVAYELASFAERLGARIIDSLIIFIPSYIVPLIGPWLYFSLQHCSNKQATVGQSALNIKLMTVWGDKVEFGRATGRFFGNILNVLTFFVGFLLFFTNPKRQCLHDMLADTLVVRLNPIGIEQDEFGKREY